MSRYLFYYFKILGIAPMTMNETKSNRLFKHSKLGTAYEIFLFLTLLMLNIFSINYFYRHHDMTNRNAFEKTFNCLQDSLILVTAMLTLLSFIIQQKRTIMIANKIHQIRQSMMLIDLDLYQKIPLISRLITVTLVLCIFWSSMSATIFMYGLSYMSKVAPIYICTLIAVSLILQYCVLLKYLEVLFTFVNDKLSIKSQCFRVEITQIKSNNIDHVSRLYISLREVSRNVSEFYAPMMLMIVLNIFLGCISSTYYIVKPFVFEENKLPLLFLAHNLTVGALYAVLLVTLTTCVDATVYQVNLYYLV